jgi:hypothetical protein
MSISWGSIGEGIMNLHGSLIRFKNMQFLMKYIRKTYPISSIPPVVYTTKKYKYYQSEHLPILENVWGEIIKKVGAILVLALAILSVHVLAEGIAGNRGVDILGKNGGIFETQGSTVKFPEMQDTNIDTLTVGNDKAMAFGNIWKKTPIATATNNLEIKKNQYSRIIDNVSPCKGCCVKVNLEHVNTGNRVAMAFGPASAANHIKIITNQQ